MKTKKKIITIILFVLITIIPFGYYSNQYKLHFALNSIIEIDRAKNQTLFNKGEVDYDRYVDNSKLIDYYKHRDKYNILWAENNNVNNVDSIVGFGSSKGIILFNRCFVFFTAKNNIIDTHEPLKDKTVSYNRFVSLRAKGGRWYITKAIWNYVGKVGIKDIFDSSYLDKKISEYEAYIQNYKN